MCVRRRTAQAKRHQLRVATYVHFGEAIDYPEVSSLAATTTTQGNREELESLHARPLWDQTRLGRLKRAIFGTATKKEAKRHAG